MNEKEKLVKIGKNSTFWSYVPVFTLLLGSVTQSVTLPFWITSFGDNIGGPYFIVCWASFIFTTFFGIMFMIVKITKKPKMVNVWHYMKNYIVQGLANCMNGIFVVYSSPIKRTPPILFLVIGNINIFFSILFTRLLVKEKKKLRYSEWRPMVSMGMIICAIAMMIGGKLAYEITEQHFKVASIIWIIFATIGVAFGSLYNVLQERYLTDSNKEFENDKNAKDANKSVTLFWTSLFQLIFMILFFWVDIIPFFGFTKIDTFLENINNSFGCFFGTGTCSYQNSLYGLLFTLGYIVTYISTIVINEKSANFANYTNAAQTPLAAIVFYITKLGTETTPLWSIIPTITFISVGIYLWKNWEIRIEEKERIEKTQQQTV